jgi:hypothetical protein
LPMHCLPSLLCRVFLRLRRVLPALGEAIDSGSDGLVAVERGLCVLAKKIFQPRFPSLAVLPKNVFIGFLGFFVFL